MPQTILIVAKDANITYLLQRYAEKTGFQTITAHPSKDIGALAQQTVPAVIIVEDDFPGTLHRATLRQLKSVDATRGIPVVMYTCLEHGAEKPAEGVASYLRKSVKYDDFVTALKQAGANF